MNSVAWPCAAPGGNGEEFALIAGPPAAAVRLLIVPALFEEANRTRRMLVETMRALAAQGVASVLADLPGCNESMAALDGQDLVSWRAAMVAAAGHFGVTHVVSLRGGTLVAPATLGGWRFEPIAGAQVLRPMLRARTLWAREEGRTETIEGLLAGGRVTGIELAGYRLSATMVRDMQAAQTADSAGQEDVKLADLGGAALWLRSEPGEDGALSTALAARLVTDVMR